MRRMAAKLPSVPCWPQAVEQQLLDGWPEGLDAAMRTLTVTPEVDTFFFLEVTGPGGDTRSEPVHVAVHPAEDPVSGHLKLGPESNGQIVIEDGADIVCN